MNIDNPFETFEKTAFRLEALPEYIVENEADALRKFKLSGKLSKESDSEWEKIVKINIESGKSMKRLRLLSDELTQYEQFELLSYPGIQAGEEIRINARSSHKDKYVFDFWFFDSEYITQMNYGIDGKYISSDTRKASDEEKKMLIYWLGVFEGSKILE